MIICSKRTAICCSVLSVWAIVQLTLMGILLYSHALAFAEDLDLKEIKAESIKEFIPDSFQKYESAAHNCWIGACLYIATLALAVHQYVYNRRIQYQT